jgi:hypothetical protein
MCRLRRSGKTLGLGWRRREHVVRRCPFGNPRHHGIARINVPLRIHGQLAGLAPIALASARPGSQRADYVGVPVHLHKLTIQAGSRPHVAKAVKVDGANQVLHLNRPDKLPVRGVLNNAVLLAIADPDYAGLRIYRAPVGAVEFRVLRRHTCECEFPSARWHVNSIDELQKIATAEFGRVRWRERDYGPFLGPPSGPLPFPHF